MRQEKTGTNTLSPSRKEIPGVKELKKNYDLSETTKVLG